MDFSVYKMLNTLTEPATLFVALLLVAATLAASRNRERQKRGAKLCVILVWVLVLSTVFSVGTLALLPLENRYALTPLPEKVDGIVMLTGDENPSLMEARGVPVASHSAQRHIQMARLAKKFPKARLVVVGTTTTLDPAQKTKTRDLVQNVFDSIGIPASRVTYEEKSRTTHENALFTAEMIKPKSDESWVLVTSGYHMPRSVLCFQKAGWKVTPAISDYYTDGTLPFKPTLNVVKQARFLTTAMHEYVGLLSYWVAGWIERPWG